MADQTPSLLYTQSLLKSGQLQRGQLSLIGLVDNLVYIATSGLPGHQGPGDYSQVGKGPIPPGIYEVSLSPTQSNLPGINGLFFPIRAKSPAVIPYGRSAFGIHHDSNVPGTNGCIGVHNRDSWNTLCVRFDTIRRLGYEFLDLVVKY